MVSGIAYRREGAANVEMTRTDLDRTMRAIPQTFDRRPIPGAAMSDLDDAFTAASQSATALAKDPGNEAKLQLYALSKQATSGDVSGKKPGRFDMVGRAKYEAWEKLSGTTTESAKQSYVDLVRSLGG